MSLIDIIKKNINKSLNAKTTDVGQCYIRDIVELPSSFDKTQVHIMSDNEKNNSMKGIYEDGMLINVNPRDESIGLDENRQIAYSARYIISDGVTYDLYNVESVCSIHIPNFKEGEIYTVRDLSYILKMRATTDYEPNLSVALVYKAVNLMIASNIGYGKKDYIRLINQLRIAGKSEYAQDLKSKLERILPFMTDDDYYIKRNNFASIRRAYEMKTDYVEIPYLNCTCAECAKYQGRVYSLSGKDNRLPKLPDFIKNNGIIHESCRHNIYPIYLSDSYKIEETYLESDGNVVTRYLNVFENSNRPFSDDRRESQKKSYENYIKEKNKYSHEMSDEYIQRRMEYNWICYNIPELAPKTLSGYTRMKNSKSKKYLELKQKAMEAGYELK